MSVSNNVGGFSNRTQMAEAKDDYQDMLRIRASLNARYNEANVKLASDREFNIKPAPAPIQTAEEEVKDQVLQNTRAFESLKKLLKDSDASQALSKLQNDNEVADFNRFATRFLKEVEGQSNITPTVFDLLWTRYKEKLLSSDNTGIEIGAQRGEYEEALDAISDRLRDVAKSTDKGRTKAADLIIEDVSTKLLNMPSSTLQSEFEKTVDDEFKSGMPRTLEIPDEEGYLSPKLTKQDARGMYIDITPEDMIQYIIFIRYGTPAYLQFNYAKQTFANPRRALASTSKLLGSVSKADVQDAKDAYIALLKKNKGPVIPSGTHGVKTELEDIWNVLRADTALSTLPVKPPATINQLQEQIKRMMPKEVKAFLDSRSTPKKIGKGRMKGTGIFDQMNNTPPVIIPSIVDFGRYKLNVNSLNQGFLHLRYKKGAYIAGRPRIPISQELAAVFFNLIYHGKFEEEQYDELSEDDKKLFDDTLEFAHMSKYKDVDLFKHKRYNSKEKKEDINRFNLLKGQLLSGNDNKNVIKEFKALLIKMLNDKTIDKSQANKIFYELFLIQS